MVCRGFTINESITQVGIAKITMDIAVSDSDGLPVADDVLAFTILDIVKALLPVALLDLATRFEAVAQNVGDAIEQQTAFMDDVVAAADVLSQVPAAINKFQNAVANYRADVASLIAEPGLMAARMGGIFDSMDAMYQGVVGDLTEIGTGSPFTDTLSAYERLFAFGDDDIEIIPNTHIRQERIRMREVMTSTVKVIALAKQYENAVQITYDVAEDVDAAEAKLYAKFVSIVELLPGEVRDKLNELRTQSGNVFDEMEQRASRITEVHTAPISTRLLSYAYYGTSEHGETIQRLNSLPAPRAVGLTKILTDVGA